MNELDPPLNAPQQQVAPVAAFGLRLAGRIIDGFVLLAPLLLWTYVLRQPGAPASDAALSLYLLVLAFSFANDVALTSVSGSTIGKRICGTRVARVADQKPVTMGAAAIRWFVMTVLLVIPFGAVADALYIFSGELKQTLHDRAAGTIVVQVPL
ncbi:MAG: RDD family protein [Actinomycetota bacterium]